MASPQNAKLPWIPVTDGLPSGDDEEVFLVFTPTMETCWGLASCVDESMGGIIPGRTGEWWPMGGGERLPRGAVTHYCRLVLP